MSFNVRYGTAPDGKNGWSYRRPLVSQLILDNAPHVLGIQEGLRFQLDDLSADLNIYEEVGCGRDDGKNAGEHSSILYKKGVFDVLDTGTFWFSETPDLPGTCDWGNRVPRICTWVVLQEKKKQYGFYLYNLHLDHRSSKSRRKSVLLLIDRIIKRDHKFPVIITGDFNVGERNAVIKYLSGKVTHGVHNEKCPIAYKCWTIAQ
jgi:endonuclease/exonuclease/phosphatase family metal-dependent hydrolase